MVPAGGFHDDRLRAQLSDQCFPDSNASMDHPDHPIDCRLNEWVWLSEDVAEQVWAGPKVCLSHKLRGLLTLAFG